MDLWLSFLFSCHHYLVNVQIWPLTLALASFCPILLWSEHFFKTIPTCLVLPCPHPGISCVSHEPRSESRGAIAKAWPSLWARLLPRVCSASQGSGAPRAGTERGEWLGRTGVLATVSELTGSAGVTLAAAPGIPCSCPGLGGGAPMSHVSLDLCPWVPDAFMKKS